MTEHDIWGAIGSLVQERMDEVFPDRPEEALGWLETSLGSPARAKDLLSGASARLSPAETTEICQTLQLDSEVVGALISHASNEVLLHVTGMTIAGCPVVPEDPCPICASIAERHERARASDARCDLERLALEILAHIHSIPPDALIYDEAGAFPLEEEIRDLLAELPQSARLRVLAAAHEEHERFSGAPSPSGCDLISYLGASERGLLSYLLGCPEGSAKVTDAARDLGLTGSALVEVERRLVASVQRFSQEHPGTAIQVPLLKVLDAEGARYRLHPGMAEVLRAHSEMG